MINGTLFRRELNASVKLLVIFGAILTMYVACMVGLYDPATVEMLDGALQRPCRKSWWQSA